MEAYYLSSFALRAAIGAGLGLIAGSFVAAASMRWPAGRSVVRGRSACDHCAAPLGPAELIDVSTDRLTTLVYARAVAVG